MLKSICLITKNYLFQYLLQNSKKISLPEEALIEALLLKQRIGAEALYSMYSSSLMGVISRIIIDTEIAEDVLQETLVKIWNSISQYSTTKGRLFTWMVHIARNMAIDKVRSKDYRNHAKNQDLDNLVNTYVTQRNVTNKPEHLGIKELVTKLKPDQYKIVDLIYFKGYTHIEVAQELSIPLGTVKTRLRMGIIELRKYF